MIHFAIENSARLKLWLHLTVTVVILIAFILAIARIANKGSLRSRSTSYGIPVVSSNHNPTKLAEVSRSRLSNRPSSSYTSTQQNMCRSYAGGGP